MPVFKRSSLDDMNRIKKFTFYTAIPAVLTFIVILFVFNLCSIAPFGNRSLAAMDANIQYLDFFSYLKDVFAGENSIFYTFGKTLGGSNIAVFSYYLSSPFSILVLFFEKWNLHAFFNILVALKLSLAAATFAIYIYIRFNNFSQTLIPQCMRILLPISYALSQYCIAQSSNIMWLDSIYMLPLILAAIYRLIQGKKTWPLSICIGLNIIFNWYTAGINCIFSGIYVLVELMLTGESFRPVSRSSIKTCFRLLGKYVYAIVIGIFLSAVLFLPTIAALRNSSRGSLELNHLLNFNFIGDIPSIISLYSLGATSTDKSVSLFCGSIALIGCIGIFLSKCISKQKKVIFSVFLGVILLAFFWEPLRMVFSLFKSVYSYWNRYSYIGIFTVLFIAAFFYCTTDLKQNPFVILKIGLCFAFLQLLLSYVKPIGNIQLIYRSICYLIIISSLISFIVYCPKHTKHVYFISGIMSLTVISELFYSAYLQIQNYHVSDVQQYKIYVNNEEAQIKTIKAFDSGIYRISQTVTRNMTEKRLTANYNESLGYNYWSISGYTSSPDDIQRNLLNRLGYRINGNNMCVVNTSILGADSLLGVKYILSDYPIQGLEKLDNLPTFNEKAVYKNPYCLPFAFTYTPNTGRATSTPYRNPFEYQNDLYSQLMGETIELYTPIEHLLDPNSNSQSLIYHLTLNKGNFAFYGNLPWIKELNATLNVNNGYQTAYAQWLSPSVFYIPIKSEDLSATISLTAKDLEGLDYDNEQFYALNLTELKRVTDILSEQAADYIDIQNGQILIKTQATESQKLYLSVPFDKGWDISVNGQKVVPTLFADCMYSIPLQHGDNTIEMVYYVPYLNIGIIISLLGILLLGVCYCIEKKFYD